MSKTIELVRQEVEEIKNEVEDFANSASRIGEAMSDILEYNKELTEIEANRAKDVEQSLSEEINDIKEAISNIGGEGGEGSKEVTRAEFELVKVQSEGTFNAFSKLGMTEKADIDGYEIALAKATNTAEKTKVKVPVFDAQNMAKNPVGLVDEIFVEGMANMMDNKIDDALKYFTPPEEGGESIEVIDNLDSTSTTAALSANQGKVLNEKIEQAVNTISIPDDEDVTKTEEGKLKFANREYDSLAPNGMGYVILRKNKALTQQITSNINNTIYEIRYDFDLGGETVYVGNGCVFKFAGGKISNGTIDIKNDSISEYDILRIEAGAYQIFDNVTINGEFTADKIYVDWFGAKGDYNTDDTEAFRYAIKTLNGKGKSLYLGSNKIYVISGPINYYDGENNSLSKIQITSDRAKNDEYPYDDKRPSCLFLKSGNISLFKGNEGVETAEDYQEVSMSIKLSNIEIVGSWINWYEQKNKLFDNCVLLGTSITDCSFKYLYCMFYQTGLWSVTAIMNNRILGIYNFSERGDLSSGKKVSFVDSSIKGNYINGGAPKAGVLETVDNIFFDWNEFDGSTISENFIDYYCTMYNSGNYSAVTTNNQYQVFKYFHKNCNVYSVCDRFSWNYGGTEEEPNTIYELMNRYKGIEYTGHDGNTYIIPPYIASDRYLGKNVIFKDMMIEGHIKNIIYRTGFGDSGNSGQKFIVQLHDIKNTKYYRNDAIVYPEGGGSGNTDYPVFCNVKPQCVIYIDPSLVTEVTTKPTLTDFTAGGWGKIGMGQVIKYGEALYQLNVYMNNGSMTKQVSLYMPENTIGHRTGTLANAPGSGTGGVANGLPYFATDINMPVFFNTQGWKYMCADGYVAGKRSGTTAVRTALPVTANDAGLMFFDKDLGKVVVYNGSAWVNADDGYAAGPRSGARRVELTGSLTGLDAGLQFYDTLLRKLVIWNGDWWEDLEGNEIIDSENE